MRSYRDHISQSIYGRSHRKAIADKKCVICGMAADKFRDAISLKEYHISGMCQKCQDRTYE